MVDQMLQNSTKQFYASTKKLPSFNKWITYLTKKIILIQPIFIYLKKWLFWFNELLMYSMK